jgi:hypothetical protein
MSLFPATFADDRTENRSNPQSETCCMVRMILSFLAWQVLPGTNRRRIICHCHQNLGKKVIKDMENGTG